MLFGIWLMKQKTNRKKVIQKYKEKIIEDIKAYQASYELEKVG